MKNTEMQNNELPKRYFSRAEWEDIGYKLENFHSIFSTFWDLGKPNFTRELPTAGVYFDKLGDVIDFNINPEFWDTLTEDQKLFVICHEVTHVLFYHGFRITSLKAPQEFKIANLALDIVVNHFLTDTLGFNRTDIDPPIKPEELTEKEREMYPDGFPNGKYCWIDTVFPDKKKRPVSGQSFEYYYTIIKQELENNPNSPMGGMSSLDDHESLESFINQTFENKMKEAVDNTTKSAIDQTPQMKEMAKKELDAQDKKGGKQAGTNAGNSWITSKVVRVIPKRKWETVIKNWASKYLEEKYAEQWQKPHRRLVSMPRDFLIPAEQEIEEYENKRIPVYFFLDTSGSCAHLADRFFTAAMSLPEDRFILNLCCFDTRVYETDLKSKKLYGFGGTTFTCIEEYLQSKKRTEKSKYADAVFVLTDGYGNMVNPEKPNRWFWFLSENYKDCIPKECKTFDLKDFE